MFHRPCAALVFLALLTSTQISAQESWWELYDLALADIKSRNWNLAEERLKAAYRQQSEQGPKIRSYGARFIRYFPEYYLAVVHFHQGKYQQALEEFLRVQNKGLIKEGDAEFPELTRLRQETFAKIGGGSKQDTPSTPSAAQQIASLMDESRKSLAAGNFEQARSVSRQAAALDPDDTRPGEMMKRIDLQETLAELRSAMNENDWSQAQRAALKLEKLDPQNSELARFRQMQSKIVAEEEIPRFETLVQRSERELAAGDYGNARKTAQQALSAPGADAAQVRDLRRRIEAGEASEALVAASKKGDQASAQKIANKLEGIDPENAELLRWKRKLAQKPTENAAGELLASANRELARNNFRAAREWATQARAFPGTARDAETVLKRIELGENIGALEKSIASKDWKSAQTAAARISELDPQSRYLKSMPPVIEEGLAMISFYSGQYQEAATLFKKAVQRQNRTSKAYFYLGCSYAALALLQPQTDQGKQQKEKLLQYAREQFAASRKLDPSLKYDQRFISPRVLEFYERVQ